MFHRNQKMGAIFKKVLYFLVIPSTTAFVILVSGLGTASLDFAAIIGFLLGAGELVYLTKKKHSSKRSVIWLSVVVGGLICFVGANIFFQTCTPSTNAMRKIIAAISSKNLDGLLLVSLALGILSLPSVICFLDFLIPHIICVFAVVDYQKVWEEFAQISLSRSALKRGSSILVQILIAALCATMLLAAAYSLPIQRIDEHVAASALTMKEEGAYPILSRWFTSQLDNFTDSIILAETASGTQSSPIQDAMDVPRGYINGLQPCATLVSHYIDGKDYDGITIYPRYWHGYLVLLKPLMQIMDYSSIRVLNGIVQLALVILTCVLLFKKGTKIASAAYILSYCMMMPLALAKSFQFSPCFYVYTLGSISLLLMRDETRRTKAHLVFFYCGIFTAFFDFLTYPIATFGVPLAFFLLLAASDSTESKLCGAIRNGIFWCIGLVGMWASKWIVASIITGQNVIMDGIGATAKRTSIISEDGAEKISVFFCEIKNYAAFLKTPFTICAVFLIGYLLLQCVKKNRLSARETFRILLPFILTSLAPVAWYAFATNHSETHYYFTNKACVVSFLSLCFGLICLLQSNPPQAKSPG